MNGKADTNNITCFGLILAKVRSFLKRNNFISQNQNNFREKNMCFEHREK